MGILEDPLNRLVMPTLRIVMTNECNGKCFFCHREGSATCPSYKQKMSIKIIADEVIPVIQKKGINKVIFTGGEPTMHSELSHAIQIVKMACEDVNIGITTNGYNVGDLLNVKKYIDKITISASSLNKDVFMRYTMIDPLNIVEIMSQFDSVRKAVSIVITEENIDEINQMITFFTGKSFDVKLQFVISQTPSKRNVIWEQLVVQKLFDTYGMFDIKLGATPLLYKKLKNGCVINIKLASLNAWMYDNIFLRKTCVFCEKRIGCVERGCSIRIFPDGKVTYCLNQFKCFTGNSIGTNLREAYEEVQNKFVEEN